MVADCVGDVVETSVGKLLGYLEGVVVGISVGCVETAGVSVSGFERTGLLLGATLGLAVG